MAEVRSFDKRPVEDYTRAVEFSGRLPFGAALSTGTVAAKDLSDGSDATSTVLDSATATINGTQARYRVKAGTVGTDYEILVTVTLGNGETLQEMIRMSVKDL